MWIGIVFNRETIRPVEHAIARNEKLVCCDLLDAFHNNEKNEIIRVKITFKDFTKFLFKELKGLGIRIFRRTKRPFFRNNRKGQERYL